MTQILRERCESLTQQRDRQLAEVRRLEGELYQAQTQARREIDYLNEELDEYIGLLDWLSDRWLETINRAKRIKNEVRVQPF